MTPLRSLFSSKQKVPGVSAYLASLQSGLPGTASIRKSALLKILPVEMEVFTENVHIEGHRAV